MSHKIVAHEKDPVDRISTMDILKHRFFNGPTRELSPRENGLKPTQSTVEEETCADEKIDPPLRTMLKQRQDNEGGGSWVSLYTMPVRHPSQQSRGKRVGLETLLEEIDVSSEYQKGRPSSVSVEAPNLRQASSRRQRPSLPISGRHVSGENSNENKRHDAYSDEIEREYPSENKEYGSNRRQTSRLYHHDNRCTSKGRHQSLDSHHAEKEARFDLYENDELKDNPNRRNEPLGYPSPGEGLRNALGNIENRLNNKTANRQSLTSHELVKEARKRAGRKGFATLVEELVQRPAPGIAAYHGVDKLENIDPTSRQQRSEDIHKSLLSLLSSLNRSENRKSNNRQERYISPILQPPIQESKSFTPLLPSKEIPSKPCSENDTFASRYVFSTVGIPPLTQRTKHGLVKIIDNGNVELSLPSISRNTFSISSDSKDIAVSDGHGVVWRGEVDELPWRWTRVYRYASRFVAICRAKIPYVSVEVDGVKGRVMLNGEFEACDAREGIVIRLNLERGTIKVSSINEEDLRWQGDINEIPGTWKKLLRSSILLYQKCLSVSSDQNSDDTAVCVPGIGWCVTRGQKRQLLFEDGVRMEVNLDDQEILYFDANRTKERLRLNKDRLPTYIKERLDRCRGFKDVE
jgi:hypothetical protein